MGAASAAGHWMVPKEGGGGMKHPDIHATLGAIRYQYPTGVTTFSPCHRCHQPARGGGPCFACLEKELMQDWHVPFERVRRLLEAHEQHRAALCELEDVRERVIKAAGG